MRIAMLTLRNFRSHQETVLQLDRFHFIRGPNGCRDRHSECAEENHEKSKCRLRGIA